MIKYFVVLLLFSPFYQLVAQADSEVFLMDIDFNDESFKASGFKNISNNGGYDSQPHFLNDSTIVFASTNKNQVDIKEYCINSDTYQWYNYTTSGGEYSPQRIPNTNSLSAVRLDTTGLQRLYSYKKDMAASKLLLNELQVAYYAFYNDSLLVASVLSGSNLDLVIANTVSQKTDTLLDKSGRSIHKVPASDVMSYTSINEEGNMDVYQLDMLSRESFFVAQLPIGVKDFIWLDDSKLLIGSTNKLYLLDLFNDESWKEVADLSTKNIQNITRLALSPNHTKIAIVAQLVAK